MTNWIDDLTGETRAKLLRLVRRSSQTITALADAVGLTDNAVRTHIAALERDGIIEQVGSQRDTGGKPARLYALTGEGEELFPKAYALVLGGLIEEIAVAQGHERAMELLSAVGRRVASGVPDPPMRTLAWVRRSPCSEASAAIWISKRRTPAGGSGGTPALSRRYRQASRGLHSGKDARRGNHRAPHDRVLRARGAPALLLRRRRRAGAPGLIMQTRIAGFHVDDEGQWVAELECGHTRHMRHDPPWQVRPWVLSPEGHFILSEPKCWERHR